MHPEGTTADEENKMSAKDVATLAQHLIKDYPKVLDTAKILKRIPSRKEKFGMSNWNWMLKGLVKEYDGVDGLKQAQLQKQEIASLVRLKETECVLFL